MSDDNTMEHGREADEVDNLIREKLDDFITFAREEELKAIIFYERRDRGANGYYETRMSDPGTSMEAISAIISAFKPEYQLAFFVDMMVRLGPQFGIEAVPAPIPDLPKEKVN